MANFQRDGSISNAQVGNDFENAIKDYFLQQGISLVGKFILPIGIGEIKKAHAFDLGSSNPKVIVECKSHKWTVGNNVPSAKVTVWNEAMYYFAVAPADYRKIFMVLRDFSAARKETLAEYYLRTYGHLVPLDVEIWEFDEKISLGKRLK